MGMKENLQKGEKRIKGNEGNTKEKIKRMKENLKEGEK